MTGKFDTILLLAQLREIQSNKHCDSMIAHFINNKDKMKNNKSLKDLCNKSGVQR